MKSKWMALKWVACGLAIMASASFVACDGTSKPEVTPDLVVGPLDGNGVIYGTLVDAQSGHGLADASVVLTIGGRTTLTTTTFGGASTTDVPVVPQDVSPGVQTAQVGAVPAKIGDFAFEMIPSGEHLLTINQEGYAKIERFITVYSSPDQVTYASANDLSSMVLKMAKGFDAKVAVMADGRPIPNAAVFLKYASYDGLYAHGSEKIELNAVTDAEGIAVFPSLSQLDRYNILVPAFDENGDGAYDYITSSSDYDYARYQGTGTVWSVNLTKFRPSMTLTPVGSSCANYPSFDISTCPVKSGDPIYFVFNIPVTLTNADQIYLTAPDIATTAPASPAVRAPRESKVTAVMSAANTVLTLTPDTALIENYTYTFKTDMMPRLSYQSAGRLVEVEMLSATGSSSLTTYYVNPVAPLATEAVSLDNYDGFYNVTGAANQVYLKLPKKVIGTVAVLEQTEDGVITVWDGAFGEPPHPSPCDGPLTGSINADHRGVSTPTTGHGCDASATPNCGSASIHYKVALPVCSGLTQSNNNSPDLVNTFKLRIIAQDLDGNKIDEVLTLPVN